MLPYIIMDLPILSLRSFLIVTDFLSVNAATFIGGSYHPKDIVWQVIFFLSLAWVRVLAHKAKENRTTKKL